MCEKELNKSVFLKDSDVKASNCAPGSDGYAASLDKKGNVIVAPLNESTNRIDYSKLRSAVLKNR